MPEQTSAKSLYRSMTYRLVFREEAQKEWKALGHTVQQQFKAKLAERLEDPHVPASRLHGVANRYKIKLATAGYRLVYEVRDAELVVSVIAVGRRERSQVYKAAARRR